MTRITEKERARIVYGPISRCNASLPRCRGSSWRSGCGVDNVPRERVHSRHNLQRLG